MPIKTERKNRKKRNTRKKLLTHPPPYSHTPTPIKKHQTFKERNGSVSNNRLSAISAWNHPPYPAWSGHARISMKMFIFLCWMFLFSVALWWKCFRANVEFKRKILPTYSTPHSETGLDFCGQKLFCQKLFTWVDIKYIYRVAKKLGCCLADSSTRTSLGEFASRVLARFSQDVYNSN